MNDLFFPFSLSVPSATQFLADRWHCCHSIKQETHTQTRVPRKSMDISKYFVTNKLS